MPQGERHRLTALRGGAVSGAVGLPAPARLLRVRQAALAATAEFRRRRRKITRRLPVGKALAGRVLVDRLPARRIHGTGTGGGQGNGGAAGNSAGAGNTSAGTTGTTGTTGGTGGFGNRTGSQSGNAAGGQAGTQVAAAITEAQLDQAGLSVALLAGGLGILLGLILYFMERRRPGFISANSRGLLNLGAGFFVVVAILVIPLIPGQASPAAAAAAACASRCIPCACCPYRDS